MRLLFPLLVTSILVVSLNACSADSFDYIKSPTYSTGGPSDTSKGRLRVTFNTDCSNCGNYVDVFVAGQVVRSLANNGQSADYDLAPGDYSVRVEIHVRSSGLQNVFGPSAGIRFGNGLSTSYYGGSYFGGGGFYRRDDSRIVSVRKQETTNVRVSSHL